MNAFNYLKGWAKGSGEFHAVKALSYIVKYHGKQKRNDGTPYILHPVKVASHLAALHLFPDKLSNDILIASAVLHDVIEDTPVTHADLCQEFCKEIADVVQVLSKEKGISNEVYYTEIRGNIYAMLVKIADRCHNLSTAAGVFKKERLVRYVTETEQLVFPLVRYARDVYPEVSDQVVLMSYHIKAVVGAINVMLPLMVDELDKSLQPSVVLGESL